MPRVAKNFDEKEIRQIETLAGYGLTLGQIAAVMGVSLPEFQTRRNIPQIRAALDTGRAKAEAIIGQALFTKAKDGDVKAIQWWEMSRAKRRATQPEGDDGTTAQRMKASLTSPDDFAITFVSVSKEPLLIPPQKQIEQKA